MNKEEIYNLPSDTPLHIQKKQNEIWNTKSNKEKLELTFGLIAFSYNQTMALLKKKLQTEDEGILKAAYIETVYKDDFSAEEMERIKKHFTTLHKQNV